MQNSLIDKIDKTLSFYRKEYLKQKEYLETKAFGEYPRFACLRQKTDGLLDGLKNGLSSLGINEENAIAAVDGSLNYGIISPDSDVDGAILILKPEKRSVDYQILVDKMIEGLGRSSNMIVLGLDRLSFGDLILTATTMLTAGRYIIGDFDPRKLAELVAESTVSDLLTQTFEKRFFTLLDEGMTKYLERLREVPTPQAYKR